MTAATTAQDLADRFAIQDLVYSYNHAIDGRDEELFASLWTEDAVCGAMEGRETIVGALKSTGGKYADLNHMTTNLVITLEGDRATARSKSIVSRRAVGADVAGPLIAVEYTDELVRQGGAWKFTRRTFQSHELGRA